MFTWAFCRRASCWTNCHPLPHHIARGNATDDVDVVPRWVICGSCACNVTDAGHSPALSLGFGSNANLNQGSLRVKPRRMTTTAVRLLLIHSRKVCAQPVQLPCAATCRRSTALLRRSSHDPGGLCSAGWLVPEADIPRGTAPARRRPCTSSRGVEAAPDTGHSFGSPSPAKPTFRRGLDCRRTDDVVARLRRWERPFSAVDRCCYY
jgi:hypothetical protein